MKESSLETTYLMEQVQAIKNSEDSNKAIDRGEMADTPRGHSPRYVLGRIL
jgi:hypothetical protein